MELRPDRARRRARADRRREPTPPPFLASPLAAGSRPTSSSWRSSSRFVEHPVRAFLRERLGISVGRVSRRGRRRAAGRARRARRVGGRPAAARGRARGAELDDVRAARSSRAASLPPGTLADAGARPRRAPVVEQIAARAAGRSPPDAAASLDVNLRAARRPPLDRARSPASAATRSAIVSYSRVTPRDRLARVGAAARADRRPARAAVRVGRRSAGPVGRRDARTTIVADPAARRRTQPTRASRRRSTQLAGARRPLRPRHARAAAARVRRLGGVRRRPPRAATTPRRRAQARGRPAFDFDKEDREPEHVRRLRRR